MGVSAVKLASIRFDLLSSLSLYFMHAHEIVYVCTLASRYKLHQFHSAAAILLHSCILVEAVTQYQECIRKSVQHTQ